MHDNTAEEDATNVPKQEGALLSSFLRASREDANFSIRQAADESDIECERLARIEIGAASPTSEELDALCALYACDIDSAPDAGAFLPQLPSRAHRNGEWLLLGPVVISLEDASSNGEILEDVSRAIRKLRNLDSEAPVHIRKSEIPMIASLLDLDCDNLPVVLTQTLRLSAVMSYELVDAMRSAIAPEAALVGLR